MADPQSVLDLNESTKGIYQMQMQAGYQTQTNDLSAGTLAPAVPDDGKNSSLTSVEMLLKMKPPNIPQLVPHSNAALLSDSATSGHSGHASLAERTSPKARRRQTGYKFDPYALATPELLAKNQDPNVKPEISFLSMCIYAINSAPPRETGEVVDGKPVTARMLSLSEVYQWIMDNFPFFKSLQKDGTWKNSVRHNLSLSPGFKKVQRPADEPGKGQYWMIELNPPGGDYTPKRNRRKAARRAHASLSPYRAHGQTPSPGSQSGSDAEYRGRSRSLSARGGSREASPGMPHVNNLYSVSSPNVADLGTEYSIHPALMREQGMPLNSAAAARQQYLTLPNPSRAQVSTSLGNLNDDNLFHYQDNHHHFHPGPGFRNQLSGIQSGSVDHLVPSFDRGRSRSDPAVSVSMARATSGSFTTMTEDQHAAHVRRSTMPNPPPQLHQQYFQQNPSTNNGFSQPGAMPFDPTLDPLRALHESWSQQPSLNVLNTGSLPAHMLGDNATANSILADFTMEQGTGAAYQTAPQQPFNSVLEPLPSSVLQCRYTVPTVSVTDDSNNERPPSEAVFSGDMDLAVAAGGAELALPSLTNSQHSSPTQSSPEDSTHHHGMLQHHQHHQHQQHHQPQETEDHMLQHGQLYQPSYQQFQHQQHDVNHQLTQQQQHGDMFAEGSSIAGSDSSRTREYSVLSDVNQFAFQSHPQNTPLQEYLGVNLLQGMPQGQQPLQ